MPFAKVYLPKWRFPLFHSPTRGAGLAGVCWLGRAVTDNTLSLAVPGAGLAFELVSVREGGGARPVTLSKLVACAVVGMNRRRLVICHAGPQRSAACSAYTRQLGTVSTAFRRLRGSKFKLQWEPPPQILPLQKDLLQKHPLCNNQQNSSKNIHFSAECTRVSTMIPHLFR